MRERRLKADLIYWKKNGKGAFKKIWKEIVKANGYRRETNPKDLAEEQ